MKTGQTFRQIINLQNLDACDILSHVNDFPMIKRGFEWLNTTLVGMVHKCPYKALKFMNATYAGVISDDIPSNWQVLPNGIYKIQLRVSDSFDDKIAEVIFCQESNIRKRRLTDLNM